MTRADACASFDTDDGHHKPHAFGGELGIREQSGGISQAEQFGEMRHRAGVLLTADQAKVRLMIIEISEKTIPVLYEEVGAERDDGRAGPSARERRRLRVASIQRLQGTAGAIASKMPRSASLKPCSFPWINRS
jgi:hypothetical protein